MISNAYCLTMAQYSAWMNRKMCRLCGTLTDDERKSDRGAFFRSIHGTLDHLVAVDLMLLSHVKTDTPTFLPKGTLHENFESLRRRREGVDGEILDWAGSVSPEWLTEPTRFTHDGDGLPRMVTRGF